jgi:hypothetical protein
MRPKVAKTYAIQGICRTQQPIPLHIDPNFQVEVNRTRLAACASMADARVPKLLMGQLHVSKCCGMPPATDNEIIILNNASKNEGTKSKGGRVCAFPLRPN